MNEFHEALLLRSLNEREKPVASRGPGLSPDLPVENTSLEISSNEVEALVRSHDAVPLLKKRHSDRTVMASLAQLVACRVQEGYKIASLALAKGSKYFPNGHFTVAILCNIFKLYFFKARKALR